MYTEDQLNDAMLKVLEKHEKIPYTEDGLEFLLTETVKLLPRQLQPVFTIQTIEEMSVQDRAERKLPKIMVTYE